MKLFSGTIAGMKSGLSLLLLLLILLLLPSGCDLINKDDPSPENKTLISYEQLTVIPIGTSILDILLSAYSPFSDQVVQNFTSYSVSVYKVIYKTTYRGVEQRASGVCIIPETGGTTVPIASYQHGTIFSDAEAPSSFNGITNASVEIMLNLVFASCGFICSVPDYIGFNESGDVLHPYHLYEPTADACIDMLRAVRELCAELNVPYQEKYFLFGYSEGGYATLATLKKIQASYMADFPITACCAGAGAYDLPTTISYYLNRSSLPGPAFMGFMFASYNYVYGWSRLGEIFKSPYSERIAGGLYDGSHDGDYINGQLTSLTADLFQAAFLNGFRGAGEQTVKNAFWENSLYQGWFPQAPTRLYHGTADDIVPVSNSATADQAFRNSGATAIQYFPLAGLNHSTAIVPYVKETIVWFKGF
jgi:pimeloyl-ACP methyl ester carboxylesterase